ncbi:hydrogenase maturation nickel metallochaperone HypA [Bradyrhizobium iriomotense]|uniref:Hydrogenase maturation factor HypA n=1 Tax=Bradyrhizobium iriomotense TaxID=441950 RepID=A0ABQ6AV46_9BRAD|nr:hydrogenase maturation nickel metallochaperone HypA [Bradyrhizobium iriomotense]GLR83747.1 putative hydrogenase nickel incorporation protein HypA [Bradyrhizobium iriomotense]
MHELGITRNIVAIVSDAAKGRRVCRITVDIGELSGVMGEAVAFCFETVAKGSPLEGAVLDIRRIAGRAHCAACRSEFDQESLFTPCPCGSRQFTRLQGEELRIRSMEIEEEAA